MSTKPRSSKPVARRPGKTATPKAAAAGARANKTKGRKKDTGKLFGRFGLDFAAVRSDRLPRADIRWVRAPAAVLRTGAATEDNPALLRLLALAARDASATVAPAAARMAPVDAARANWTPMGPLAVPNGQTYGGARVLISGRVTAIVAPPDRWQYHFRRHKPWRRVAHPRWRQHVGRAR